MKQDNALQVYYDEKLVGTLAMQIASLNGHLCHIRRTARDIISGQERTH